MIKELKKEWMFASRSGRLFILLMSFLFLAVLTPVMLKLVIPEIFAWQFPNLSKEDIDLMVNASQLTAIQGFMSDLFELGMIILVFTLSGMMAQEIRDNTLVFPIISGSRFAHILTSKFIIYSILLSVLVYTSILITYAYSGLLFDFDVRLMDVVYAAGLLSVYFSFIVANLLFWGVILKRTLPAGFVTLVVAYLIQALGGLLQWHTYLPSGMIHYSSNLSFEVTPLVTSLLSTGVIIIVMLGISYYSMKKMEYNLR